MRLFPKDPQQQFGGLCLPLKAFVRRKRRQIQRERIENGGFPILTLNGREGSHGLLVSHRSIRPISKTVSFKKQRKRVNVGALPGSGDTRIRGGSQYLPRDANVFRSTESG